MKDEMRAEAWVQKSTIDMSWNPSYLFHCNDCIFFPEALVQYAKVRIENLTQFIMSLKESLSKKDFLHVILKMLNICSWYYFIPT